MQSIAALAPHVGISCACQSLAVARGSYYRAKQPKSPLAVPPVKAPPPRALSEAETDQVRTVLNSERFADCAPREACSPRRAGGFARATLLDEGTYLCAWRTMYRILDAHQEVRERRHQLSHPAHLKPQLVASAPNQLWSWDITKLLGPTKWVFYYLYVLLDVYSRYVTGWLLAEHESSELAEHLIQATCVKQGIGPDQLTIHADRGAPMIAKTLAQLLSDLGVTQTHARPHTPNDNPYSEAQFKTLKYRPDFPACFGSRAEAHRWAQQFFPWYNHDHHHTALGLLTPSMVHHGHAAAVLETRQQVLRSAYQAHPERFVKGPPQAGTVPAAVWINRPQPLLTLTSSPEGGAQGRTTVGTPATNVCADPLRCFDLEVCSGVVRPCGAAQRARASEQPFVVETALDGVVRH